MVIKTTKYIFLMTHYITGRITDIGKNEIYEYHLWVSNPGLYNSQLLSKEQGIAEETRIWRIDWYALLQVWDFIRLPVRKVTWTYFIKTVRRYGTPESGIKDFLLNPERIMGICFPCFASPNMVMCRRALMGAHIQSRWHYQEKHWCCRTHHLIARGKQACSLSQREHTSFLKVVPWK